MKPDKWLLHQPAPDVLATLEEEGCAGCFGCPMATLLAAEITHRSTTLLEFTFETGVVESDIHTDFDATVKSKRVELSELTANCSGYEEARTEDALRPAKMCNSPDYTYHPIQVIAGRILEFFNLQ